MNYTWYSDGSKVIYLNQHKETLEDFLLTASRIGFGKTRAHVMMYAKIVARKKNLL